MIRATAQRISSYACTKRLVAVQQPRDTLRRSHYTAEAAAGDKDKPTKKTKGAKKPTAKRPRIQDLAIVPNPSAALSRMAQKIKEGCMTSDAASDIEKYKFSTDDLLCELPKRRTMELGSATRAAAYMVVASAQETHDKLMEIRKDRAQQIVKSFRADQLKDYLAEHGQKKTGTKGDLVDRIIDHVWGVSFKRLQQQHLEAKPKTTAKNNNMTLQLNPEAFRHLKDTKMADALRQLEADFSVSIRLLPESSSLCVDGPINSARSALSSLRELLMADTTVEVKIERHVKSGKRRALSYDHVLRLSNLLNRRLPVTVSNYEGKSLFVGGSSDRLELLHAQQQVVNAVGQQSEGMFAVVPTPMLGSAVSIMTMAAAVFSQPRGFIPQQAFHSHMPSQVCAPVAALSSHALFGHSISKELKPDATLTEELREYLALQAGDQISTKLGRVLVDLDSDNVRLNRRSISPEELLEHVGKQSPLYGFAPNVSPLKWLTNSDASKRARTYVELQLRRIKQTGLPYELPQYEQNEQLTVRMPFGKWKAENVLVEQESNNRVAYVAMFGASNDLQVQAVHKTAVDAVSERSRQALAGLGARLDIMQPGGAIGGATLRQHETVELELNNSAAAQYAVVSANVESVVSRSAVADSALAVRVHQTWNVLDDLRYSQVELTADCQEPMDEERWSRYLVMLFQAAFEPPTVLATSIALK
ncbi:hypothetical protein GGI07_004677 [Coemansia sp. Benny D115]|nr:hypothetical protein GGI07_004677 [Coemansia sp. Benny D115]